jgi:hypothetical protein
MATLQTVLADPRAAGLYRVPDRAPVAAILRRVEEVDLRPALLDGDAIGDKGSLLRACAAALDFPPYFGRNWDALADCLADLSWLPASGHIILYDNPAPLIRRAPRDWAVAREIFADAADAWRARGIPFAVLLRRTAGLVPDIPLLVLGERLATERTERTEHGGEGGRGTVEPRRHEDQEDHEETV